MRGALRAIPIIVAVCIVGAAPHAAAQPAPRAAEARDTRWLDAKLPSFEALRVIPADADAVVACRSLASVRATAMGEVARAALETPALGKVREGWIDLSRAVGLEPEAAFDAILGERVVLALRRTDSPLPDWTIQASVDAKTEQLLRRQLKVAPRTIVAGQTLYAVERGALELSVARSADRAAPARIVLAPAGSRLFEDIVRGGPEGARSVLDTPMGRSLADAPQGDIIVLARLRERADAWGSLVGSVGPASFTAVVRGSLTHAKEGDASCPGWSEAQAREIARDAAVAVFDTRASALAEIGDVLGEALPEHLLALFEQSDALTGREAMLLVPGASGAPTLVAGVELTDMDEGARLGDDAMDAMLEMVGVEPRRFGGVAPTAVRRVDGPGASLAWGYSPVEGGPRAWWIHTTDPEQLATARVAFAGAEPDDRGVHAAAFVRPSRLLGMLRAAGAPLPAALDSLGAIESAEWIEFDGPARSLSASLSIRFTRRDTQR